MPDASDKQPPHDKAEREPPGGAAHALESVTDGLLALDRDWRFTYVNAQAERVLKRTREELLGRGIWDEFPEAVGGTFYHLYRRAVAEGVAASVEDYYAPLDVWMVARAFPSPDGLSVFFQDVTARRRAEEALRESEARRRAAQARLESVLAAGGIGTWDWDLVGGRLLGDATVLRLFSLSPEEAAGGASDPYMRAIHPDDRPRVAAALEDAIARRDVYKAEYRVVAPDGEVRWLESRGRVERDAAGRAVALPGVTVDVTAQAERGRRGRFLAELAERAQRRTDPEEVIADAVRSVGEFLGVSRCIFADIDIEADTCAIRPDYRADDTVASITGVVPISAFGAFVVAEYAARRAVAVDDVRADPIKVPPETLGAYEAIGIRAHITVPVVHSDRVVSCMSVHNAAPRRWAPEEVELLRAVVERTWLTVEVLRQQRALAREAQELRAAHTRITDILESIGDGFIALDAEWRFTYLNDRAERVLFRARAEVLGRVFWDVFPETVGTVFERHYRRAVDERASVTFEEFFPPLGAWFEVRVHPSASGLSLFFQDVTARRALEDALRRSREDLRLAIDAAQLGTFYCDWPFDKITWNETCKRHFFLPPDADVDFDLFYSLLHPDDRAPTRAAIDRAMTDHVEYNVEYRALAPDGRTRWVNAVGRGYYGADGVPLRFDGITLDISARKAAEQALQEATLRTAGILESITDAFFALDREWRFTYLNDQGERLLRRTRGELLGRRVWEEFPEAVGSSFDRQYRRAVGEGVAVTFEEFYPPLDSWFEVRAYPSPDGLAVYFHDIGARRALEAQRERLADANRLLLESTGEGIYGIDAQGRFTFVNGAAARMLGFPPEEMLGRNGHALIHHSRHDGTPYPERDCPIYRAVRLEEVARVEDDVFWRRDGTPFPVSFSAAPITEGGAVTGAVVTFSDIGARKAMEAERAQIAEREHRIAEQLQAALQPDLPGALPGLAVARHYEAALTDQAGVGGDFYDVFSVEKGRTALVLGDLSGKGLQAAAAVATVRNMLRAFLYTKPTVAEAATELNRVLAENNLLKGFTTLFVSAYDSVTRVLNFVNCGQEPALVRRAATGEVETLLPTGPILGTLENARYTEGTITLAPGDALAVFSDGITECGPSRTEMLGIEGVTALFQPPLPPGEAQDAAERAERLMLRLIAGVDAAAAGGVMRDDVCLLVAVAT